MRTRVAIFGGAFDPIHNAHLAAARAAALRFHLDRVLFVPTYRPPHKTSGTYASYEDRVRMVELACATLTHCAGPRFECSRIEEGGERSYSIETIEKVRATLDRADMLYFLIGADAFAEVRTWHRWRDVVRAVTFIVASRPCYTYDAPENAKVEQLDQIESITSSTQLRRELASGNLLLDAPEAVLEYIRAKGLYGVPRVDVLKPGISEA
jgi:nicotinate-nucleotide adenylyltransferase